MHITVVCALVILKCPLVILSMKLSPCARWNKTGVTVACEYPEGNASVQVDSPQSIYIHNRTNTLYVADAYSKRILMIPLDQQPMKDTIVASLEDDPEQMYVNDEDDGPAIYVTIPELGRVEKWVRGTSSHIIVGERFDGISVDNEKNVYLSSSIRHYVCKWSPQTNTTTIVAGEIDKQSDLDQHLHGPLGIHVDRKTHSVYVADFSSHRVQKWTKKAEKGITVAGKKSGSPGSDPTALYNPYSVLVDDETHTIYVVDYHNYRIQRWLPNATEGDTIAGDTKPGRNSHQFTRAQDVAFDNKGNLYVCDTGNRRIQMFSLIDNQPCPAESTTDAETLTTTTIINTTAIYNHAVSSYGSEYNEATMIITTFSMVLWFIKMQL